LIDWLVGMMGLLWTFTIVDIEQFLFGVKMVKKQQKVLKSIFLFLWTFYVTNTGSWPGVSDYEMLPTGPRTVLYFNCGTFKSLLAWEGSFLILA
jgi:hypothetical protein